MNISIRRAPAGTKAAAFFLLQTNDVNELFIDVDLSTFYIVSQALLARSHNYNFVDANDGDESFHFSLTRMLNVDCKILFNDILINKTTLLRYWIKSISERNAFPENESRDECRMEPE